MLTNERGLKNSRYHIEYRFQGKAKYELKNLIKLVRRRFRIRSVGRPIPHISLAGPFATGDENRLLKAFVTICARQPICEFNIREYGTFEDTRVVYVNIVPDANLDKFQKDLASDLAKFCKLQNHDHAPVFGFHSTIAMKLNPHLFYKIKAYTQKITKPNFKHVLIRATLLKDSYILSEYDFMLRKQLNRTEAKNREILRMTYDKLGEYLKDKGISSKSIEAEKRFGMRERPRQTNWFSRLVARMFGQSAD